MHCPQDSRYRIPHMQEPQHRKKRRKWPRFILLIFSLFVLLITVIMINTWSAFGGRPRGERLTRMTQSPQYTGNKFSNELPTYQADFFHILRRWFFEKVPNRTPSAPIPVVQRDASEFTAHPSELRITWFGHSSFLVELDGRRILVDPVWGDYASPGRIFGVKRFYAPPISLDDLPEIDAVVLSHDHYDHLNEPTIKALRDRIPLFVMPLGMGAHLESWGVPPERIVELDWWEQKQIGEVTLVCTPARHFSGRFLTDRDATLWASWAFIGENQRAYFSGDSGMFPGFQEIGDRLGPFDITMMESGAYNVDWPDVHMGPEQAVQAHQMVRGNLMIPVHWGTFALAFHGWTEPVERVLEAAASSEVNVVTPKPGESVSLSSHAGIQRWWPNLPWRSAEESPIFSTGLQ